MGFAVENDSFYPPVFFLHFRGTKEAHTELGSFLLFKKTEVDTACKLLFNYQVTPGYRENCVS